MLIRITNRCNQACRHCGIDASGPEGEHMTSVIFDQALDLADRLHQPTVILSGGEPTLHPACLEFIDRALAQRTLKIVVLATNGAFLADPKKTIKILKRQNRKKLLVQVTNDPRYYEKPLPKSPYRKHFPVDTVPLITPCRRTKENNIEPTKQSPSCFNLRALVKQAPLGEDRFEFAVQCLTQRAKFCTPSVNIDGSLHCGEFDSCADIGYVTDTLKDIAEKIAKVRCKKCGLWENLGPEFKKFLD